MGFLLKSAFWLGVVYSAMPLGQLPALIGASDLGAVACSPTGVTLADRLAPRDASYRLGAAAGCAALAASRGERSSLDMVKPASDSSAAPARVSVQTLTDGDKQPPWIGPDRQATNARLTQSWRAPHPMGYKRVANTANTHPERQTVDD